MNRLNKWTVFLLAMMSSCSHVTKLDSDDYNTAKERVEILMQEIHPFSEIQDAEFELFNVNGFKSQSQGRTIPGASSWDYRFAIKVDTADVSKWTEGMIRLSPEDNDNAWTKEIIKNRPENWSTSGKPVYCARQEEDVTIVLYREDGIIFKRVIAN